MKAQKFTSSFTYDSIKSGLSALPSEAVANASISASAYSFTKRSNPTEFNSLLSFLPTGYVAKNKDKLESIDLVCSGSTAAPFLITIAAGRNDTDKGKELFDIDVFNIAPDTDSSTSYFLNQWYHYKDSDGNRTTIEISPLKITDELTKKDLTYAIFLTGSDIYYTIDEYQKDKKYYFDIHNQSFKKLVE